MNSTRTFLGAVVLVTTAFFAAGAVAQERSVPLSDNEQSALGATRTINTAEVAYDSTYKKGYSVNLWVLGEGPRGFTPSAAQAGLVASELARGKWHNYVFTYRAGAKDKDGRITAYTLTVRPTRWRKGLVSYFTDQTGVIRWTKEHRAPTAKDPTIDSFPGF
jgi:hypothetical protein